MPASSEIQAPYNNDIVLRLNACQLGVTMIMHPFTCAHRGDAAHAPINDVTDILVATPTGWRCPFCDYQQDWAWSAMAGDELKFQWEWMDPPPSRETALLIRDHVERKVCIAGMEYRKLLDRDGVNRDVVDVMLGSIRRLAEILKEKWS